MIRIDELTKKDVGRYVFYTDMIGQKEIGRIKSWNDQYVFVVYNCAEEWNDYHNYTAAATRPVDLDFEKTEAWDRETNRFDLMEFD